MIEQLALEGAYLGAVGRCLAGQFGRAVHLAHLQNGAHACALGLRCAADIGLGLLLVGTRGAVAGQSHSHRSFLVRLFIGPAPGLVFGPRSRRGL